MKTKKYFIIILLFPIFTSCATIFSAKTNNIEVTTSNGQPATADIDGRKYNIYGPTEVKVGEMFNVENQFNTSTLTAENETSEGSIDIDKKINLNSLLNILLGVSSGAISSMTFGMGALMGILVTTSAVLIDAATGNLTKPEQNKYVIPMQEKTVDGNNAMPNTQSTK